MAVQTVKSPIKRTMEKRTDMVKDCLKGKNSITGIRSHHLRLTMILVLNVHNLYHALYVMHWNLLSILQEYSLQKSHQSFMEMS